MGTTTTLDRTVADLRQILGERASTSESDRAIHGRAETHFAPAPPDIVVYPESIEEIVGVVRVCARDEVPIVPYGTGTSVEGHVLAVHGGVCVDLSRMNRIVRLCPEDLDATVEAGVTRTQLDREARRHGLAFFVDPGADASIGGMASTRASGTTAVRYGTMRETVLGLTVVLADGRVITTGGRARKSSAGYDLTRLFVGSEGTLGILAEITVRLHGVPDAIAAATCAFETIDGAVDTIIQSIQLGIPVARAELLDEISIDAVNRFAGLDLTVQPTLCLEFHGASQQSVAEQAESVRAIAAENGGSAFRWATAEADRHRLWEARHKAYFATLGLKPGASAWATDICVPISRLAECVRETKADLAASPILGTLLGHVGDGNFHMIYLVDPADPSQGIEAQRLADRAVERALSFGGTCSGEHGIGLGKIHQLTAEHGAAVDVMRAIKRTLDPRGIMNPGKIFG
jgi:D-lactate dehydrogenase (cytochrome)